VTSVRKLHALKRRGQRVPDHRATLRGRALKVSGRTITADLTGRPEGNYNARLTSRYHTHTGTVVTVKTTPRPERRLLLGASVQTRTKTAYARER
jgi:hypothetical protein